MKFLDWYLKIAVVSALVGGSMEIFMIKTGFCVRTLLLDFIPDSQSYPFVFLFFYELDWVILTEIYTIMEQLIGPLHRSFNILKALWFGFYSLGYRFWVKGEKKIPKLLVNGCVCICIELLRCFFFSPPRSKFYLNLLSLCDTWLQWILWSLTHLLCLIKQICFIFQLCMYWFTSIYILISNLEGIWFWGEK